MPDYELYNAWLGQQKTSGKSKASLKYYTDYSIGYLTRGCFRKCSFCVNKNYDKAVEASPISEFLDPNRKKICLLDDNFLSHPRWEELLNSIENTSKRFRFIQGLDERILNNNKCYKLFQSKYDGDFIFAFDNIRDKDIIIEKMGLIRSHTDKICTFYTLCAYDERDIYDESFWIKDIEDLFERIKILMSYRMLPYVMRYEKYKDSPFCGIYVEIARWCNQPSFFKKKSFYEFLTSPSNGKISKKRFEEFNSIHPEIVKKYFYMKFD